MNMFRDLQSTMSIMDTVHFLGYLTRILYMTAFVTQQLLMLARNGISAGHAIMLSPVRPFVRLSVHLSHGCINQQESKLSLG